MRTAGIVAEFNPFHNGHEALVRMARERGVTHVVAVMSGNFVQRGTFAITDKRVRTRAALSGGVDLVVELPVAYATGPAPRFAWGAVRLLQATGCVDLLCFGSESGDVQRLRKLARAVDDPALGMLLRRELDKGVTFARARETAVAEVYGQRIAGLLATPNNALGVEYLRQASALNWPVEAVAFPRQGVEHDDIRASGRYASASLLRSRVREDEEISEFVPPEAAAVYERARRQGLFPAAEHALESAVLSHLRRMEPEELAELPDLSEGLEDRLYKAVRAARSLDELEQLIKTKRYTMARVRRLVLAAFLGLRGEDCETPPPYVRILGFSERGRELMRRMKAPACTLPAHVSLARLRELGGDCARFARLEERSTDLFSLSLPRPLPCGYEYTAGGVFVSENRSGSCG